MKIHSKTVLQRESDCTRCAVYCLVLSLGVIQFNAATAMNFGVSLSPSVHQGWSHVSCDQGDPKESLEFTEFKQP